jgi:tRNA nucleotidyltransferase (CCA-adding enzyme)
LEEILAADRCLSLKDLALRGEDLLEMGIPKGPQVGLLLRQMLDEVLEERLPNEREALVKFIQEFRNK